MAARGDVRRAKLYYLRDRVGRASRVRERRWSGAEEVVVPGLIERRARCPPTTRRAPARRSSPSRPPSRRPRPEAAGGDGAGRRGRRDAPSRGRRRAGRRGRAPRGARARRRATTSRAPRTGPRAGAGGAREEEAGAQLARRAGHDRGRRARPGARHPGVPRQALPDPERVDGARRWRSASACSSTGSATASAIPTAATSSSSSRRRASRAPAAWSAPSDQPCPRATTEKLGHELHQAGRRRPRRPPEGHRGVGLHQREAPERAVRPARPRMRDLQPARARSRFPRASTT